MGISGEQKLRKALSEDFSFYAEECLVIRPKEGGTASLTLNAAQEYINNKLNQQYEDTGKVRALILKGRQQGASTYTEGRFYWRVTHRLGARAFILTHEAESTSAIFEMVQRYHDNCPQPVRPTLGASNAKELHFPNLDSGYKVGTAGNATVGRGQTVQYFHGSEVAFWKNTGELTKGILQAVPDAADTEIILESTANGVGNYFHQQWQKAVSGESEYIPIFVPWHWQPEYTKPVPDGFQRTKEEIELVEQFGLTDGQLVWRRNKIIELSVDGTDGERAFKQEYPNYPDEAFQNTGEDGFILPVHVMRARRADVDPAKVKIVGVDPSRGGDRFSTITRAGRKAYNLKSRQGVLTLGDAVSVCRKILDDEQPNMMFVDAGGGADLVDRLHELGYQDKVKAIAFGAKAHESDKYRNKRAEMYANLNNWLTDDDMPVQIPDKDSLQADLCAPRRVNNSMELLQLERKEEIKKRGLLSPDEADALALTFAEPVREIDPEPWGSPSTNWMSS